MGKRKADDNTANEAPATTKRQRAVPASLGAVAQPMSNNSAKVTDLPGGIRRIDW